MSVRDVVRVAAAHATLPTTVLFDPGCHNGTRVHVLPGATCVLSTVSQPSSLKNLPLLHPDTGLAVTTTGFHWYG